jgi:hypothetical protein
MARQHFHHPSPLKPHIADAAVLSSSECEVVAVRDNLAPYISKLRAKLQRACCGGSDDGSGSELEQPEWLAFRVGLY